MEDHVRLPCALHHRYHGMGKRYLFDGSAAVWAADGLYDQYDDLLRHLFIQCKNDEHSLSDLRLHSRNRAAFFQNSSNVLIGHYVNLFVFVVACWVASRIIYNNYCESYVIREMVAQSKLQIEKEMEENRIVSEKLAVANAQLRQFALIDELTGLSNRRRFREYIDKVFQSNASPALTMSIIMIDVDYFKQYNDSFGHETGDKALSEIAKQIDAMVKAPDQIAVRWGGEEFIYSAFGRSSSDIVKTANALRMNILNLKISNPSSLANPYITISQGTCTGAVKSKNEVSRIIKIADQALYLAKANGRNCVATLTYQSGPDNEAP